MQSDLPGLWRAGARVEVTLDGQRVDVPGERRSVPAIRAWLEKLALEQQRALCFLTLDGVVVLPSEPMPAPKPWAKIAGITLELGQLPLYLVHTARTQTAQLLARAQKAVGLVLINEGGQAREFWWGLAQELKQPLLTLSQMPVSNLSPTQGSASPMQLRRWQLEQLAAVIEDVDRSCVSNDSAELAETLEKRVLPWLQNLQATLDLWQETLLLGDQTRCRSKPSAKPIAESSCYEAAMS
jgi:hypothetical protein